MDLISVQKHGLLGQNFYWHRRVDYNLTEEELSAVGIVDNQVYVDSSILPVLTKVDQELQKQGWRLYVKEGYRSPEMYKLIYNKRIEKHCKEITDKLLNMKDMKHASGLSVDVSIWDIALDKELELRKREDGPDSLFFGFYKNSTDPDRQQCHKLQEYLSNLMFKHGFKYGSLGEYFHFDFSQ